MCGNIQRPFNAFPAIIAWPLSTQSSKTKVGASPPFKEAHPLEFATMDVTEFVVPAAERFGTETPKIDVSRK